LVLSGEAAATEAMARPFEEDVEQHSNDRHYDVASKAYNVD